MRRIWIANIMDVDTEVLFKTDISIILFSDLKKLSMMQDLPKAGRRILKRYQNLCKLDPRLRNEDLPEISDVSDDNEEVQGPVRSFCSLFTSDRRRSVICAGINSASNELCNVTSAPVHMASSTIVADAVPEKRKRPAPPLSQVFLECLEADSSKVMASTPATAFVRSDSLFLTPPPPTPPSVRSPSLVLTPPSPTPSPSPPPRRRGADQQR